MNTYSEFQQASASKKAGLVILEAARRLVGWTVYLGNVYVLSVSEQVIVSVTVGGVALTAATSVAGISAGKFYQDRQNKLLYVQLSDSSAPDAGFVVLTFNYFFSNVPVRAPHDLASGFDVEWLPLLDPSSTFLVQIENTGNYLGVALSSPSTLKFANDPSFWQNVFDQVTFESHLVQIYSWSPDLPITQAAFLYRGIVTKRTFDTKIISIDVRDVIDELRSPVSLSLLTNLAGVKIPDTLNASYQRRVYGFCSGLVPTPIDQVVSNGYPLTGTLATTNSVKTVTGTGTLFLRELSPGDDVQIGGNVTKLRIDSVDSDTQITLAEAYPGDTLSGQSARVNPSTPKRYANRKFLVAGHALARPALNVVSSIDASQFYVDSTDDVQEGDTLEYNGAQGVIRVLGDGFIKLVSAFTSGTPPQGAVLYRSSVGNVYLDSEPLTLTRDYTYDATQALITLTDLAEFNICRLRKLTGTLTLVNGNRNVVGVGTVFTSELSIGDWIRLSSGTNWFEILSVTDDLNLVLRSAPGVGDAGSGAAQRKNVAVYDQTQTVLSCDTLGKMDSGGNFIKTAAQVALDLIGDAGLSSLVNASTFTTGADLAPYRIGLAIPTKYNDRTVATVRDTLNKVCRSVFATILQNKDYQIEFSVVEPSFATTPAVLDQHDVQKFSVVSDATQMVSAANVTYQPKEWDPVGKAASTQVAIENVDQFLSETDKQFTIDTILVEEEDAIIMASRWAFLLARAGSDLNLDLKMQASRYQINDVIEVALPKLYTRYGSGATSRIGVVLSVKKSIGTTSLIVSDVGNAFTRVARIAPNTQAAYTLASDGEKLLYGFQTDANGLTAGNPGINLIW
jgi:hypothetical protein